MLTPDRLLGWTGRGALLGLAAGIMAGFVALCADASPRPTLPADARAQAVDSTSCVAAFDTLQAIFQRDYPGYREKVAGREDELVALADSVRAVAQTSDDHDVCIPALWRWTAFFRDPHVMLWQAGPPPPKGTAAPSAAPQSPPADDPLRPSLQYPDDSTAVLRLPTFDMGYEPAIDSLVAAHRARLLTTPYLIVDVRGNGGGYTGSFRSVLPMLYAEPFFRHGMDVWTSAANVAHLRSYLTAEGVPEDLVAQLRAVLPAMEANPNQLVPFAPDEEVVLDAVHPLPRAVAILVDGGCASSCENFVLDACQSRKVTVLGVENTRGMIDYGNVRATWLPGWRRLRLPTSRSRRLPDEPLDGVGIAPEVRLPDRAADAVAFARRYLRGAERAPR